MGLIRELYNWGKNACNNAWNWTKEKTANGLQWVKEKTHAVIEWIKPKPVLATIYVPTPKEEKIIDASVSLLRDKFPNGIRYAAENATVEERKERILEIIREGCEIYGIDHNQLDVTIDSLDSKTCGEYNWRNHKLTINEDMIASNDPALFEEQVYTVFHELTHAVQIKALSAYANDKPFEQYGYTEEQLYLFAQNWPGIGEYITAPYEDYCKQPVEAYAFGRENRIKLNYNNSLNA